MDASRRVNSPLVIQFKPMTEALHLQSGSEDRSTRLQMTAGVEVYVRVFRLPLFCLIFTGSASGLDKKEFISSDISSSFIIRSFSVYCFAVGIRVMSDCYRMLTCE